MITIRLTDDTNNYSADAFEKIHVWCLQFCSSYVDHYVLDTGDSARWDAIAEYNFGTEKDANWFSLKWQ